MSGEPTKAPTKKELNDAARREATKEKQLEEIAKQVVATRKRPDKTVQAKEGDNSKIMKHNLELFNLPKVNMADTEEVDNRVREYFEICMRNDMKPSVTGLALSLGVDRTYLWEIRTGRKGKNPDVANVLKNASFFLETQMADYLQNGELNPLVGFFFMKNNFNYTDKTEVVITPNGQLGEQTDTKELEDKYSDSIVEAEFTEKNEDS